MDKYISADVREAALEVGELHPVDKQSAHNQSTAHSDYNPIEPAAIEKEGSTSTQVLSSIYGPDWSKPVDKLSEAELMEQYKLLSRHVDTYPTREEVEKRIQDANDSIEEYNKEYAALDKGVTEESKKLPKLRKRLQAAQAALSAQMALIERMEKNKKWVQHIRSRAAQDRFAAQVKLDSGLGSTKEWLDQQSSKRLRLNEITDEMNARGIY